MRGIHKKGFTLIELMIVVSIIAILAAIGIPVYSNYVKRSRQVEAKTLLMTIKVEQEQYRAEQNCYTTLLINLPETSRMAPNNRLYTDSGLSFYGNNAAPCNAAGMSLDYQVVVKGLLRPGIDDWWGISDAIPAPVHCDGRSSYTPAQTTACAGKNTTELEY